MGYIRSAITCIGVILFLDFLITGKKIEGKFSCGFFMLSLILARFFYIGFMEIYLFLFFLSVSLVILALKRDVEKLTAVGIGVMVVMLYVMLKYSII